MKVIEKTHPGNCPEKGSCCAKTTGGISSLHHYLCGIPYTVKKSPTYEFCI